MENIREITQPRPTQITIEEALELTPIDLLRDEDQAGGNIYLGRI